MPRSSSPGTPCPLPDELVEQEQERGGRVDRHRRRHLAERDPVEQDLHVGERVDRDPRASDLAFGHRVVGVVAELGRKVERDGDARLPAGEEVAEARVRLLGRPVARVLPHRPRPPAVHRLVRAPREREGAGELGLARRDVGGRVDGLDLDARVRLPAVLGGRHAGKLDAARPSVNIASTACRRVRPCRRGERSPGLELERVADRRTNRSSCAAIRSASSSASIGDAAASVSPESRPPCDRERPRRCRRCARSSSTDSYQRVYARRGQPAVASLGRATFSDGPEVRAVDGAARQCAEQALEERPLIREVRVHGVSLNAGPLRDRHDRRPRGADGRVQVDGRFDDPLPRLRLTLGAPLELVLPTHCTIVYSRKLDSRIAAALESLHTNVQRKGEGSEARRSRVGRADRAFSRSSTRRGRSASGSRTTSADRQRRAPRPSTSSSSRECTLGMHTDSAEELLGHPRGRGRGDRRETRPRRHGPAPSCTVPAMEPHDIRNVGRGPAASARILLRVDRRRHLRARRSRPEGRRSSSSARRCRSRCRWPSPCPPERGRHGRIVGRRD